MGEPSEHWDDVYTTNAADELSWFQADPAVSLRLILGAVAPDAAVVDVGAGASLLVDRLLDAGFTDLTVLDASSTALLEVRERLAGRGAEVETVVADLRSWSPTRRWDLWHDRAVFHFLVDPAARAGYVQTAMRAVAPGGFLVLGCFAEDGPTQCSGLPTTRYDTDGLVAVFGTGFQLTHAEREGHRTPRGALQPFTWVVLRRR